MKITPDKPHRTRIDLTDEVASRAWTKKLGKSLEEIAAAIEKVGDSASAVKKELGCKDKELGCKDDVEHGKPAGGSAIEHKLADDTDVAAAKFR
jgi:hypothetical protein